MPLILFLFIICTQYLGDTSIYSAVVVMDLIQVFTFYFIYETWSMTDNLYSDKGQINHGNISILLFLHSVYRLIFFSFSLSLSCARLLTHTFQCLSFCLCIYISYYSFLAFFLSLPSSSSLFSLTLYIIYILPSLTLYPSLRDTYCLYIYINFSILQLNITTQNNFL